MKNWFGSLDARERMLITMAAVFVGIAVVWFGVWTPLDSGHKAATARVDAWKNSLAS